jgi:hypothetical protein
MYLEVSAWKLAACQDLHTLQYSNKPINLDW